MPTHRDDVGSELAAFAKFLGRLHRLVRRRMTVPEALSIIRERLDSRNANLLPSLGRGVDANPRSPYRMLLESAGRSLSDIRELLQRGLPGTHFRSDDRCHRRARCRLSWQTFRIDHLYAILVVITALGIGLATAIRWVSNRTAPWLVDKPVRS